MPSDLPVRKDIRLKKYDYSRAGCYFVTICVRDRHELLGRIVGDAAFGIPCMELSDVGKMVRRHIENMNLQKGIALDKYIVMPNHIHLLISVRNEMPGTAGTPKAASPTKAMIPQVVNALKGLTSKKFGESMWQRAYHDHIVRDEEEYQKIWQYIDENPAKWRRDCYYT